MQRLLRASLCIAIAFVTAMAMSLVTYFAYWPPRWKHLDPEHLTSIALLGALYTAAIPVLALGLISLRRIPSALLSVLVTGSWLLLAFLIRARKPWMYCGDFPWRLFWRDLVQPLPEALAVGLAFAICARHVLGPNNSFKPKPLRGSA
jgi:hypothetical protein